VDAAIWRSTVDGHDREAMKTVKTTEAKSNLDFRRDVDKIALLVEQ
jgi:hypothetical protein